MAAMLTPALMAQTANDWTGGTSGLWGVADNWTSGVPVSGQRAVFGEDSVKTQTVVTVEAGATYEFSGFGSSRGTDVTLNMGSGSTINTVAGGLNIGALYGGTDTSGASFTVNATDADNLSEFNISGVISAGGHSNSGDGNSISFTGAGLRATGSSSEVRIGIVKNNNTLTVADGAHFSTLGTVYIGRVTAASGNIGNGNRLLVDGAGTRMTINSTAAALRVGSFQTAANHQIVSGNRADVTGGAFLRADGGGSQVTVQVGAIARSDSSVLNVADAGSRMEITANSNGIGLQIGAYDSNGQGYLVNNNTGVSVSDGATIKNEGSTLLTGVNRDLVNYLRVGAGSSYIASGDIINRGGSIYLENGGSIIGETVDGSGSESITIELVPNGVYSASTLYAEGNGLGASVNVNAQAGSLISIGNADNSSVTALELNSSIQMAADSTLQFIVFADGSAGSINFGSAGLLSGEAILAIGFAGYAPSSGDEWTLFSGNIAGIDSSFLLSATALPELEGCLSWDVSRLNAEGGWVLGVTGVIPEPRTSAMMLGAGVLAGVLLLRRRAARKSA